jgi:hypothetical protein
MRSWMIHNKNKCKIKYKVFHTHLREFVEFFISKIRLQAIKNKHKNLSAVYPKQHKEVFMLKKMTALFLMTAFTHVYAFSTMIQVQDLDAQLSRAYDAVNFKLNVEWDQKDKSFFDQTIADFEKEVSALQDAGIDKTELLKSALAKIKDEQVKSDVQELAKIMNDSQMTKEESNDFVVRTLSSTFSKGASWSGHRHGRHTAVLIAAIIIILCICNDHRSNHDHRPIPRDHQCDPTHGDMYAFDTQCQVM